MRILGSERVVVNTGRTLILGVAVDKFTPQQAPSPAFPFADNAMRDPVSGRIDGLLDNDRARVNQPKVFYTNTAIE